jgi:alpha-tubulin suppressor-like RCC1 family protein
MLKTICPGHYLLAAAVFSLTACGDDDGATNNNANLNNNHNENENVTPCTTHEQCPDDRVCDFDASLCIAGACGDGIVRPGEACDNGAANSDTEVDACRSRCIPASCGDGVVDTGEICDEGLDNGVPPSACRFGCILTQCGDGYLGGTEECDDTGFGGATCETRTGLLEGELTCDECVIDESACHTCGNAEIEGPEMCDGAALGSETCASQGFTDGVLVCGDSCSFDTTGCYTCGDGTCSLAQGEDASNCIEDCGWTQIGAGGLASCAVKGDGTAWCWGDNTYGQLGDGTFTASDVPVQVVGIDGAVEIRVTYEYACVRRTDSTVWCWGNNTHGELGNGSTVPSVVPVQALLPIDAIGISLGGYHSCAVTNDGVVQRAACWGMNNQSQLGDGTTTNSLVPLLLSTTYGVVGAGYESSCAARTSDDAVFCWGDNSMGQLGDNSTTDRPLPTAVNPPNGFAAKFLSGGATSTCAITLLNGVSCWGSGYSGELGNNASTVSYVPVAAFGLSSGVAELTSGYQHHCARLSDTGAPLYCWGEGSQGQLGDGAVTSRLVPTAVSTVSQPVSIGAGFWHTCAVGSTGTAWCWGSNNDGRLGDGTTTDSDVPVAVVDPYLP